MRDHRLELRVSEATLGRLDALRGRTTRSAFVRALIEDASPDGAAGAADLDEAIELLTASARAGSVMAQRELVRFLAEREEPGDRVAELAERLNAGALNGS
jgi:hypothetical protein